MKVMRYINYHDKNASLIGMQIFRRDSVEVSPAGALVR